MPRTWLYCRSVRSARASDRFEIGNSITGRDNLYPLVAAQYQQVLIAGDDQISLSADGRRQNLIIVGISADVIIQINRLYALHQSGIAVKQFRNLYAKLLDRLPKLRTL